MRGGFSLHLLGNSGELVRLRLVGLLLGKAAGAGSQLPQGRQQSSTYGSRDDGEGRAHCAFPSNN